MYTQWNEYSNSCISNYKCYCYLFKMQVGNNWKLSVKTQLYGVLLTFWVAFHSFVKGFRTDTECKLEQQLLCSQLSALKYLAPKSFSKVAIINTE